MGYFDNEEEHKKLDEALYNKMTKYCNIIHDISGKCTWLDPSPCKTRKIRFGEKGCFACADNLYKQRREASPDLLDINIPPVHWKSDDK